MHVLIVRDLLYRNYFCGHDENGNCPIRISKGGVCQMILLLRKGGCISLLFLFSGFLIVEKSKDGRLSRTRFGVPSSMPARTSCKTDQVSVLKGEMLCIVFIHRLNVYV